MVVPLEGGGGGGGIKRPSCYHCEVDGMQDSVNFYVSGILLQEELRQVDLPE